MNNSPQVPSQQHSPLPYSTSPQHPTSEPKVVSGYVLQQKLGSGSFAVVYKGTKLHPTNSPDDVTAIKAITRTSEKLTQKVLHNLELEISILRNYRHRNIVCMHQVLKTDHHFYMFLEYCAGGDVQHLIRSRRAQRLSEGLVRRLMRDLSGGLLFLWQQQLIHRDIKPQNLLLTGPLPRDETHDPERTDALEAVRVETNYPTEQFCLKIADFGFARHLQTTSLAETLCGSPLYMAPEILQHHRYDAKADLWSVGTVLFEMIAGSPPFHGENHIDLLHNIQRKAVRLPKDVRVSKECVNLLRILLSRNPVSRAGFKEFFEACGAFVALGCNGVATKDEGTCRRPSMEPIPENESPQTIGAESLSTVATGAAQKPRARQPVPPTSTFAPSPVPSQRPVRPNLLHQFVPAVTQQPQEPGMISLPTLSTKKMPQPIELPTRRNDEVPTSLQSSGAADDGSFVMVEVGGGYRKQQQQPEQTSTAVVSHHGSELVPRQGKRLEPSPPGSPGLLFPKTTPDYSFVKPLKGMLSTSPGTGGALMGMFTGRPAQLTHDAPPQQFESQIKAAAKLLATAEDVGRRAVCVAHLGDRRAMYAMRLMSLLHDEEATPMEESSDASSCSGSRRRADKMEEEMPFAMPSDAKPLVATAAIPSRDSLYPNRETSTRVDAKPTPDTILQTFHEALTCYVKSLSMLKGAVGAGQGVGKDLQDIAAATKLTMDQRSHVNQIHKRSQVILNWLGSQFKGVLGRGDAANSEIGKLSQANRTVVMTSVEELLFQHSLGFGREGAVKQLLGHFEASRSCYRSAGLLAETLLMESKVQGEDRKTLEGYVDNFAAQIRELDDMMMQESQGRSVGSSMYGKGSPFPGQHNLTLTSQPSHGSTTSSK